MNKPIRLSLEHTYRISRVRSGAPVYEREDVPGAEVVALLGAFIVECIEQRQVMPELTTPAEFQCAYLRFEFVGLHGQDADRPWHVLDIERWSEIRDAK